MVAAHALTERRYTTCHETAAKTAKEEAFNCIPFRMLESGSQDPVASKHYQQGPVNVDEKSAPSSPYSPLLYHGCNPSPALRKDRSA